MSFSIHPTHNAPLKLWDSAGPFEAGAMQQLRNVASLPFIHHHVAGMPDVHWGMGATVGSVIATKQAIVPAAVGVDIGCGMMAVRTSLTANQLPDSLAAIRADIERAVPKGMESSQTANHVKGGWAITPNSVSRAWYDKFEARWRAILAKHPKVDGKTSDQLGSMGGGNHFIEVCLDEEDRVWVMLHSGSRGTGNRIGVYFIEAAKQAIAKEQLDFHLADKDLAFLTEGSQLFDDYIDAMHFAQDYAMSNRELMMIRVLEALRKHVPGFKTDKAAINCHHNYATREVHFGERVWVTRKGAVSARAGELGIIPGSMGTGSFIVEGLGNEESFCSCSHGAGRVMSRGQAKKLITLDQHKAAMQGIEARVDEGVLDESPAAYKDIGAVMDAQQDLVRIRHRLRQVVNVKG
ncbi:RtcB family protein [Sphingomonas sp. MG17]|uniref:3'-phosphate/5'-hydroxy nucleic acid ligase n=1 Tax=Sphingomonas tagetis TaxID=2949092 RepID=A0A9X2KL11_9SPHN|nr:RtcB family protein [Sphingomonas tagetis]MCP3730167.1 RtcB family protein [Sphingomonas tagetis]